MGQKLFDRIKNRLHRVKGQEAAGTVSPAARLAGFIIHKKGWIESVFVAGCIFSLIAMLFVNVNYDLTEYLPATAQSCIGLDQMEAEFGYPGTARLMIKDVSLYEAKQYKDKLEAVDGVTARLMSMRERTSSTRRISRIIIRMDALSWI